MVNRCEELPHCCEEGFLQHLADTNQPTPPECEGVDCSPCKKGIIKQVADFFFPPPPPLIHEPPFMPEVRPEMPPPPPEPPKKAPPIDLGGQRPVAPPMHEQPIIGYGAYGEPIYATPQPPMDWGQFPIIGPIIDAMTGIPVNREPPQGMPPVEPVGLPPKPVDAKWKWSDWRECGEDGPSGIQVRTTILGEEAKYGGKPYEYRKEQRECEMPPEPIDCVMGDWTDWTACNSPGGGSTGHARKNPKTSHRPSTWRSPL